MGYEEFSMKLGSIPEQEPLKKKKKSRVIDIESIKDKEERKYWRNLKRIHRIPDIYLPNEIIVSDLQRVIESEGKINGK